MKVGIEFGGKGVLGEGGKGFVMVYGLFSGVRGGGGEWCLGWDWVDIENWMRDVYCCGICGVMVVCLILD